MTPKPAVHKHFVQPLPGIAVSRHNTATAAATAE